MKHKALDCILLVTILVGGFLAWRTGEERSRLAAEHRRLAQITGNLPIEDPSRMHVLALETGEPSHFAWRVYCPPNLMQTLSVGMEDQSSTSWSSGAGEFIARVRFREDDQGLLNVYSRYTGGSSRMSFGDKSLADLLRGRWDEIRVEQIGTDGVAVVDPAQSTEMLRLSLPDSMLEEARKTLPSHDVKQHLPVLFNVKIGPTKP